MTAGSLRSSDRRALIVGTIVIFSMIMIGFVLPHFHDWRAASMANAGHGSAELARIERSIAQGGQRKVELSQLQGQLAGIDATLLSGFTAASAGTALAETVSEAAAGTNTQLGSIQVRTDTLDSSPLMRIGARVNVSGDIESLVLFMESIEAGPPTLAIREWSITGGSANRAPGEVESLRLDLVVEGLARRFIASPSR